MKIIVVKNNLEFQSNPGPDLIFINPDQFFVNPNPVQACRAIPFLNSAHNCILRSMLETCVVKVICLLGLELLVSWALDYS